jgi:hypothetical protein
MSKRSEHTFEFAATTITEAAGNEADYHEARALYWQDELETAIARVRETAGVKIEEQAMTGGYRPVVSVDYGDSAAYLRMQDAFAKAQTHREDAERYRTDQRVYGSQNGRVYELDSDDVHHFRLGGEERPA